MSTFIGTFTIVPVKGVDIDITSVGFVSKLLHTTFPLHIFIPAYYRLLLFNVLYTCKFKSWSDVGEEEEKKLKNANICAELNFCSGEI